MTALLADDPDRTLEDAALDVLPRLRGAFCFVFMNEQTLYAARDPQGSACSSSVASTAAGSWPPGRLRSTSSAPPSFARSSRASCSRSTQMGCGPGVLRRRIPKGCVFEYVYLARPDTTINGQVVHESRVEMGRTLAREHPIEADMVMPTPESGTPAAIGYARRNRASLMAGAWSRMPMSGGPSSRPHRRSVSSGSG